MSASAMVKGVLQWICLRLPALLALSCLPASIPAGASGFAGLGTAVEGYAEPERNRPFTFPGDHGAHPGFRIEWWYLTANLRDAEGRDYGLQWTLFRSALRPETGEPTTGWSSPQLWMGHAAVTTAEAHHVAERIARGGIGQAGVVAEPFEAWIDEWQMAGDWKTLSLRAGGHDFAYDMTLEAKGPLVFHGDGGYSVKSAEGQASYYYSQPFFTVNGTLTLPAGEVDVVGEAWLDREWSSQPLAADQRGWDWFSLSFDDGHKLMGFVLRDAAGDAYTSATWIAPDGTTSAFDDGAFAARALAQAATSGADVPVRWRLTLPQRGLDVVVEALNEDSWMATTVPYWEGPVSVSGSHSGRGYLEMTGYR